MRTKDVYKKTIQLYEKLGKKYIKDLAGITVKEFPDFVELLPKGGKVLDVGCAGGRDSKKFVQKGFKVIGIDLADVFLKEARKIVTQAKFIKMDLMKLKFPKNYFDAIWANAVLLHIAKNDMSKALKGFYRVLKRSGKLHIRVKKGTGEKYVDERLSAGEKRFFNFFSKKELENSVKKSGFKIISLKIFPDELGRKKVKWIGVLAEKL